MLPASIGPFQSVRELGRGGMGEVYLARDTRLDRQVAIKALPAHLAQDPDRLARFQREAKVLASLNHPGIGAIYGLEEAGGHQYLILEFVEGRTLADRLANGPIPVDEALTIAKHIAEALEAAHEKGVIHRDLKPANLMVSSRGAVKVLDFGLARTAVETGSSTAQAGFNRESPTVTSPARGNSPTIQGAIMGSVGYMSPEQAKGRTVDKRSDIFSFGCVLYEMLTGVMPFRGDTSTELIAETLKSEPDWSRIPGDTPPPVITLLHRCLEKDPARRLSSMGDIAITLDESSRGSASSSALLPVRSSDAAGSAAPSRPGPAWRLWALAAGVLVLSAVAAALFWRRPTAEPRAAAPAAAPTETTASDGEARDQAPTAEANSIAVLPFVNMSADKADEYLSDGMSEELITALSKISGLQVKARTSSFAFKGKSEDIRKIGEQLRVSHVLEGSVFRAGNKLRVGAQLIRVSNGNSLWSDTYDRDMADIFAVRSEVARQVAAALKIQLLGEDTARLDSKPTENLDAYTLYREGRAATDRLSEDNMKKALALYAEALEKDPKFALAYAGMADAYVLAADVFLAPKEAFSKAKDAALKAIELDDSLAEAHASLGFIHYHYDWDWGAAESEFKRAVALNPQSAVAHTLYATFLGGMGRADDAAREGRRALEHDPLSALAHVCVGWAHITAGHAERAVSVLNRAVELDPSDAWARLFLGRAYQMQGARMRAVESLEAARRAEPDNPMVLGFLGYIYAANGRRPAAFKILQSLNELEKHRYVSRIARVYVYAGLGDPDKAFEWLEKAYQERSDSLTWLRNDPEIKSLKGDPRFALLMKKIGFTDP